MTGPSPGLPGKPNLLAPTALYGTVLPQLLVPRSHLPLRSTPPPPPPRSPVSLALCSHTKENLSGLLHVPGAG